MFVSIDHNAMKFCHKHADRAVVSNLATIELGHTDVGILPLVDPYCFRSYTQSELRALYANTTGHKFEGFSVFHLQELVLGAARALPVTDANQFEVAQQAMKIPFDDKRSYKYVKGAYTAALQEGLFDPPALQASVPAGAAAAAPAPAANTSAAAAPIAAPSEAPRRGSRAVIFEVADRMWNEAGNPLQLQQVLALRKRIMVELEANHSIKKTTSSTALGEWQKVRCSL